MRMFPRAVFLAVLVAWVAQGGAMAQPKPPAFQPSFAQPAISPNGHKIAFIADGALWIVPATGGTARLLVSDSAADSHPLFSPNGKFIAFTSTKTGNGDIYLLNLSSGKLRRLTWSDAPDRVSGWSPDSRWVYFTSDRNNIGYMGAIYRVRASGGTPMPVSLELYRNEEEGVPSPNDREIALVGQGWGSTQWWRHGHAHIDDGAIWLLKNNGSHDYRRLTPDNARALWPMWGSSGQLLYYMSDRNGTDNIWKVHMNGQEAAVTHFTNGRCLWPTIAAHAHTIAFQRNFGIWTLNTVSGKVRPVSIHLGGAVLGPGVIRKTFTKHYRELAVSPDGEKLIFTVHGEIFAAPTDKAGPAVQITHRTAAHFEVAWSPNSQEIVYSTERYGPAHLYVYDFATGKRKRLTDSSQDDTDPRFSPNGKWIAFIRNANKLEIVNPATGNLRLLASGELDLHHPLESHHPFAWSPDSRWIAFMVWGARMYRNAEVVSVEGGQARPVSFLGNTFSGSVQWSPNGNSLFFETGQRTHKGHVAQVHLVPATPHFRRQQFMDLFHGPSISGQNISSRRQSTDHAARAEGHKARKPARVRIDFRGIDTRLKLLPIGLNVEQVRIGPKGKRLLLTAKVAGQTNLYIWSLNPLATHAPIAHQITSSPGKKSSAQFSPDGKYIWYLSNGKIYSVSVSGGTPKVFSTQASMSINFNTEKMVVFNEAWRWLAENYHNPKMNGVNWKAVHKRYAPLVEAARTRPTLRRILERMVGELDSSHSGVYSGHRLKMEFGRIGLAYNPSTYTQQGRFQINQIIPNSPAAITGKIAVGDYLLAIDGHELNADTNINSLLDHRIGKETILTLKRRLDGRQFRVKVKPVDSNTMTHLIYLAWTEKNRAYVAKISHGKLGYIDLPDTSMKSLKHLYREINAINGTREGVVIDVRNNYGGFVSAYALDALARRHYLNMTFRDMKTVAARPLLGQAALERPTILVTNRVTLSDGEDFTEGYEELGLGKVIGDPTAGWIIYTSDVHLLNGMIVRLPFITVTTASGKPMELHPRPVNVHVAEPLGESYRHEDDRLKAAVKILMKQINSSGKPH